MRPIMYIHSASQQVQAPSRMLINGREVKPGGPAEPGPAAQVRKTEEKPPFMIISAGKWPGGWKRPARDKP